MMESGGAGIVLTPARFVWPYGDRSVYLSASFNGWSENWPMTPVEGCPTVFQTICSLPPGYQDVFNLLPNLNVADLIKVFAVKTNDQMLVIYLFSLIRSVIALHNLINKKIKEKEQLTLDEKDPALSQEKWWKQMVASD